MRFPSLLAHASSPFSLSLHASDEPTRRRSPPLLARRRCSPPLLAHRRCSPCLRARADVTPLSLLSSRTNAALPLS
ncbi:hypothetical protein PR202_ga25030 [Eleusine coracana subsp. coracana]|uniref:Uncharacterized protein n=1 Tax=Eleusine coracana subsp. coracana TaxID=191504 RepID=A0AAV5D9L0_ELECO|nr:hypothetical protein PR202_ga25030 [Eleusine coracana subsp. coracana]